MPCGRLMTLALLRKLTNQDSKDTLVSPRETDVRRVGGFAMEIPVLLEVIKKKNL